MYVPSANHICTTEVKKKYDNYNNYCNIKVKTIQILILIGLIEFLSHRVRIYVSNN